MNKKFSTLMAIALVAGSVSAQNWGDTGNSTLQGAYRTFETKSVANNPAINMATGNAMSTGAAWSKNVNAIDASLWYQLEVEDNTTDYADVLIQERDYETGKVYLRVVSKKEAPLNASLWQIKYSKPDGVSGGYFTYINKETGLALTLDHSAVPAATYMSYHHEQVLVFIWQMPHRAEAWCAQGSTGAAGYLRSCMGTCHLYSGSARDCGLHSICTVPRTLCT